MFILVSRQSWFDEARETHADSSARRQRCSHLARIPAMTARFSRSLRRDAPMRCAPTGLTRTASCR
ncbi:hypothetical protein [Burkholderia sp. MSMB1589WGS]|uniref:hypothetical protein n=1 Tax=Burkholderia sp. MSMB1589WGS TaxID=1636425 RepID=UPI0012E92889|nr:hypothetical protein [Burkholderia sp. MSMB1589WGS]